MSIKNNNKNQLFEFINPQNNDELSLMSGIDLQELLYYLNNYYLELRKILGFDNNVTFGLELEFEKTKKSKIINELEKHNLNNNWEIINDNSLYKGAEITSPILKDNPNTWESLKAVCSIVNKNAVIGPNSGGHIHIGTQVLGSEKNSWINFIKLWAVYENIIYRFTYGDYLCARPNIQEYAIPISKELWNDYLRIKKFNLNIFKYICRPTSKYRALNFNNISFDTNKIKNTIEFRCPNGTLNPIIWQNNVNLFVNLLIYCRSPKYNDDIIEERKNIIKDKYSSLEWYEEIYLQQALELCDMLFTNNLDKLYFLRQYLKSFEFSKKELDLSSPFTKQLKL